MGGIIDDTELAWGNAVDLGFGVDYERLRTGPLQRGRKILRRMADLEGDFNRLERQGQEMKIMDRERLAISRLRVIAMRDIEDITCHILLHHKPGASREAHALALSDGMEPKSSVLPNATPCLQFDDIPRILT